MLYFIRIRKNILAYVFVCFLSYQVHLCTAEGLAHSKYSKNIFEWFFFRKVNWHLLLRRGWFRSWDGAAPRCTCWAGKSAPSFQGTRDAGRAGVQEELGFGGGRSHAWGWEGGHSTPRRLPPAPLQCSCLGQVGVPGTHSGDPAYREQGLWRWN